MMMMIMMVVVVKTGFFSGFPGIGVFSSMFFCGFTLNQKTHGSPRVFC